MVLIATVTKKSVSKDMDKLWNVSMNMTLTDEAAEVTIHIPMTVYHQTHKFLGQTAVHYLAAFMQEQYGGLTLGTLMIRVTGLSKYQLL